MDDGKLNPLLDQFKARMKIYHKAEDKNLSRILDASEKRIASITGVSDTGDASYTELVLERSRYTYNDQAEFFDANFLDDLLALSIDNYKPGDDDNESTGI